MLIFPSSGFGGSSDEAKKTEDGADELAAKVRPDTANCQRNQSGSELRLLRFGELGIPLKLTMNRHKRVKQLRRPQDTPRETRQQSFEGRGHVMCPSFDMRWKVGTSDRASNLVYVSLCTVVVVESIDNSNGPGNAKDASCLCGYLLSASTTQPEQ